MPFADDLIGEPVVSALIDELLTVEPGRRLRGLHAAREALGPLALRQRSDLLRDALLSDLADDYPTFAATIRRAADRPSFAGWLIWPVTTAVATTAVHDGSPAAFDDALALLAELTPRLTSEFALRTLLRHDLRRALEVIGTWTASPDEHVRRLASEGTRPLLPWAVRVPGILAKPTATTAIPDELYRDDSDYVRRSVANHLNDVSRGNPELAVGTAATWLAHADAHTAAVVRHGLRTLIKKGHPEALELLGFGSGRFEVTGPRLASATVAIGDSLTFTAAVCNREPATARVAIDYVVHHRTANGGLSAKTFKLATRELAPGESCEFTRRHSFKVITTRRYHPGLHAIELQVNGTRSGRADFTLMAGPASTEP